MIKTYKPTTPSRRSRKSLKLSLSTEKPLKSLRVALKGPAGRSNGKVSVRHRSRGSKKFYRVIDFKRNKHDIIGKVAALEYDPNRNVSIALISYADGEKRYILAPEGLTVGMTIISGKKVEPSLGNTLILDNIPMGAFVHNIELNPGAGGVMARSAGSSAQLMAKDAGYVNLRLPSGEIKRVLATCMATVGILGNEQYRNIRLGKAGTNRYKGVRPSVRGVAMANPSDHPHAGSYRDNGIGMKFPKSPWGWNTRGKKTRRRGHTTHTIVKDRRKK